MSTNKPSTTPSRISPSVRLALVAFALSSWFEGYSQLRHSVTTATLFDSPYFSFTIGLGDIDIGLGHVNGDNEDPSADRMSPFWRWLQRRGRRMDDTERGIMGALDVMSSLGLLHLLRTGPLFPFLITPLLTSIPLPDSHERMRSLRWSKLILASVALCLFRELERVAIVHAVALHRSIKDARDGVYTGSKVVIRGSPLPQQRSIPRTAPSTSSTNLSWMYESDEEDEVSCIICTGNNADLTQSVTSVSSHVSSGSRSSTGVSESGATNSYFGPTLPAGSSNLGPLEAFCSVAPTKHVAHRGCILRWHAAYNESQRQRMPPVIFRPNGEIDMPDVVHVVEEGCSNSDSLTSTERAEEARRKLRRAKTILKLAGFEYLLENLRVTASSALVHPSSPSAATRPATVGAVSLPMAQSISPPSPARSTRAPFAPSFILTPMPSRNTTTRTRATSSCSRTSPLSVAARTPTALSGTTVPLPLPHDHLATLRTEWPPCPGCRSPIDLHFCAAPPSPSRSQSLRSHSRQSSASSTSPTSSPRNATSLGISDLLPARLLAIISAIRSKIDKKNTTQLVTGRTIALSLSAQISFLLTISSMMHARERAKMALEAMEAELRGRRAART